MRVHMFLSFAGSVRCLNRSASFATLDPDNVGLEGQKDGGWVELKPICGLDGRWQCLYSELRWFSKCCQLIRNRKLGGIVHAPLNRKI